MVDSILELLVSPQAIGLFTFITAAAVTVQAVISIKQGATTRKHFLLTEESVRMERPSVSFGVISGPLVGFWIVNRSTLDATVTSWELQQGIPEDSPLGTTLMSSRPSLVRNEGKASDFQMPHRLRYGDRIEFLFPKDVVGSRRFRPCCSDSLGNRHTSQGWIDWENDSVHEDPGPGLITPEEARERFERSKLYERRKLKKLRRKLKRVLRKLQRRKRKADGG